MDKGFGTRAVHGGRQREALGAVVPPLYLTTKFEMSSPERAARLFSGKEEGFIYTRLGNPTTALLERKVAGLEGTEDAVAFASGIGAITAVILANVKAGERVCAAAQVYSGTTYLLNNICPRLNIAVDFVDGTNSEAIAAAIRPDTKLLYVDTPGNPQLDICDLAACAGIARAAGIPLACDNTFASPYNQNPLALGADYAVHSATKYLSGHGDALGGIVCADLERVAKLRLMCLRDLGAVLGPFEAYLIARGVKTLHLRMQRHNENAQRVAEFLESHPKVTQVRYPGFSSHPQHKLAKRQMRGFSGMVTFELAGGRAAAATLCEKVRLCLFTASLGDLETLVCHPASMTDVHRSEEELRAAGVTPGLIRLSVGCEDADDIIADLDQALAAS